MKRTVALIAAICIAVSALTLNASASSDKESLSLEKARYLAVFSLATCPPANVEGYGTVKLGTSFSLLDGISLFNTNGQVTHWCFPFESTAVEGVHGYITVSINSNEPVISETAFGDVPYSSGAVFVSQGIYFNRDSDGSYINTEGERVSVQQIAVYEDEYAKALSEQGTVERILALNEQTLDALNKTTILGFLNGFNREALDALLEYYFGSVSIWDSDDAQARKDVEDFIRESAGNVYTVSESVGVDKTYIHPHTQSYYRPGGSDDGICGKAAVMMILSFYRDGMGFDKLPMDDAVMYDEFSKVCDDMTEKFSFIFDSSLITENFGEVDSYEIYAFLDVSLVQYLKSKGYDEQAWNVINNMTFSVPFVSNAVQTLLIKDLRSNAAEAIFNGSEGKLNVPSTLDVSAKDVIRRSLERGEPALIGCIWAAGSEDYTNHYFPAVGYYKLRYDFKLWNLIPVGSITKEYVEIFDTWSWSYSSIVDFSVFSTTAMYSANSLASLY